MVQRGLSNPTLHDSCFWPGGGLLCSTHVPWQLRSVSPAERRTPCAQVSAPYCFLPFGGDEIDGCPFLPGLGNCHLMRGLAQMSEGVTRFLDGSGPGHAEVASLWLYRQDAWLKSFVDRRRQSIVYVTPKSVWQPTKEKNCCS